MKTKRLIPLIFILGYCCLLSLGCDDDKDNYLEGSLTDSYNMSFDNVKVGLFTDELSIEYLSGNKKPLKLTVKISDQGLLTDTKYDLFDDVNLTRSPDYATSPLPNIESVELTFSQISDQAGEQVSGKFKALFEGHGGNTLILRGGFSAKLQDMTIKQVL